MPLEPKHEYSAKIYAEILSAIGTKIVELAGPTEAINVFSRIARPVGEKDAKEVMQLFGLKPGNAASAALAAYAVSYVLGIRGVIVQLDPKKSESHAQTCPYGSAVSRYKHMLICHVCTEYNRGMSSAFGANYVILPDKKISSGNPVCEMMFECPNPADPAMPNKLRIDLVARIARLVSDKNELIVSTLSSLLMNLEDVANSTLGTDKALLSAKNAYAAGAYEGQEFAGILGMAGGQEHATNFAASVRETTGCKVGTYMTGGGFTLYTKNCPHKSKCRSGGFLEAVCTEYTRGLLSGYGNYEIRTDTAGPACKQDFLQASPKTEGRTQNAS